MVLKSFRSLAALEKLNVTSGIFAIATVTLQFSGYNTIFPCLLHFVHVVFDFFFSGIEHTFVCLPDKILSHFDQPKSTLLHNLLFPV